MNEEQKAAYVYAQASCMMVELAAMQAANQEEMRVYNRIMYDKSAFLALIDRYGVHHNAVLTLFNQG